MECERQRTLRSAQNQKAPKQQSMSGADGAYVQADETPRENHMREATGVGAEGGQFTVQTVA